MWFSTKIRLNFGEKRKTQFLMYQMLGYKVEILIKFYQVKSINFFQITCSIRIWKYNSSLTSFLEDIAQFTPKNDIFGKKLKMVIFFLDYFQWIFPYFVKVYHYTKFDAISESAMKSICLYP